MNVIFRFIIASMLLLSIDGCGNGGGSDTLLQIFKVAPQENSVKAGEQLTISVQIDSEDDVVEVPIEFTAIALEEDGNETVVKEQVELGGAGIDVLNGTNEYNITLIIPTDISSDEFIIIARIDPLESIDTIQHGDSLYFESEDEIEIVSNSKPDIKLIKIDIDNNATDTNQTVKSGFINYGLVKTFSDDTLLAVNDKNITISGLLSILPLVKDMNGTKITACVKLDEECVAFSFRESDEDNNSILKSEKEVDLTINDTEDISFELFMNRATLLSVAKKLFQIKKDETLDLDIEFTVENSDYELEKKFTKTFTIQTNQLLDEYIDNTFDPISIVADYYSQPMVMGTGEDEDNGSSVVDDLIVLEEGSLSDDYRESIESQKMNFYQKKGSGINKKLFSKKMSKGKWGKLFGIGVSFYGKGLLDIDGVTSKISGDLNIRVLSKKEKFRFFGIDSIVKLNPSSFKKTGYSINLKFGRNNIYSVNSDLAEKTGMSTSTSKNKKVRIKENNRTINLKYTQERQRSLVGFSDDKYFGKSIGFSKTIFIGWVPVNFESETGGRVGIKGSIGLDGITNVGVALSPYMALTADISASVGIKGVAEFGAKGELTLIEDDFKASTSGKLELVGNETEIYRFDGTLEERIDNIFLGPKGKLYGFVKYPATKHCYETYWGKRVRFTCGVYIKTKTKEIAKFKSIRNKKNLLRKKQTLFKVDL